MSVKPALCADFDTFDFGGENETRRLFSLFVKLLPIVEHPVKLRNIVSDISLGWGFAIRLPDPGLLAAQALEEISRLTPGPWTAKLFAVRYGEPCPACCFDRKLPILFESDRECTRTDHGTIWPHPLCLIRQGGCIRVEHNRVSPLHRALKGTRLLDQSITD